MPEPHLNTFNAVAKMAADGKMDYIGPNNAVPRCRFFLVQARPHKLERNSRGFEVVVLPCEILGRYAETFYRLVGQDSWVIIQQGRLRAYKQRGKHPEMWIVVNSWSVWEAQRPGRGRYVAHNDPTDMAFMPEPGEVDET